MSWILGIFSKIYDTIANFLIINLNKITVLGFILAAIAIILTVKIESMRRPALDVLYGNPRKGEKDGSRKREKEEITNADRIRQPAPYMWHHLKVKNKEPKLFNRDAALRCIATISFLDKDNRNQLRQIQAHWTKNPEPRINGKFEYTLVSMCKERDIGFREEPLDLLIKFDGDTSFYAADPEATYRFISDDYGKYGKEHPKMKEWEIGVTECIIEVELEAINMSKIKTSFLLKNIGTGMALFHFPVIFKN